MIGAFAPSRVYAEDPLLEEVKAGHRAARQAIRSFSASVVAEIEVPKRSIFGSGRYWRVGDTVRIQEGKEGYWTNDYLVKGGEIREVSRHWAQGRPRQESASRRPGTDFLAICDVWSEMLIDLVGRDGGQVSYERMLEDSRADAASRRERRDGREYVKVFREETNSNGVTVQFVVWHDVGCNYLIRKLESNYPKLKSSGVSTITEFGEPRPGVFIPLSCRRATYKHGALISARVTTLSKVRVNEPIAAAVLALPPIPSGTLLDDTINGTAGKIGSDWRPIGPRSKAKGRHPATPPSTAGSSVWDAPSTSEPASPWWWLAAASGVVFALSLGYLLVRRLRGARAEPA